MHLLENYLSDSPALMDVGIVDMMAENLRSKFSTVAESVLKVSLASLIGVITLSI
ncbi:Uncharacterised protein [Proteus mirabilis]|uniref:Uncharacterized protein n=1 Tax=Proteus mirabilis TaxID=584 RepID=A0A2X2BFQ7_PROMI|nr:Uncharacterised protein [Proteus mirabilis]